MGQHGEPCAQAPLWLVVSPAARAHRAGPPPPQGLVSRASGPPCKQLCSLLGWRNPSGGSPAAVLPGPQPHLCWPVWVCCAKVCMLCASSCDSEAAAGMAPTWVMRVPRCAGGLLEPCPLLRQQGGVYSTQPRCSVLALQQHRLHVSRAQVDRQPASQLIWFCCAALCMLVWVGHLRWVVLDPCRLQPTVLL
jgi:hypothetical protein